ncbi:MAG: phosphotransferase [Nocardioides sp.]|nr:phosphotransferase [Nocardioides sp.]
MSAADVITEAEQITAAWVGAVLGRRIDRVEVTRVGTGQIGTCHRAAYDGPDGPGSVLVKLPAEDPAARAMLAGAYRSEARFYRDLAATVAVRVPDCHFAQWTGDGAAFSLVLEDLAPAEQGDQVAGCSPAEVEAAAVNLAGLHGPRWSDSTLLDIDDLTLNGPEDAAMLAELWGPTVELFLARMAGRLDETDRGTLQAIGEVVEAWSLGRRERFGLVHGDYRLDNLLFAPATEPGPPVVHAVDWQTLSLALPARDLAYLVSTSLDPATRRAHEEALVASYHQALVGHGVSDHPVQEAWEDYRFAQLQGPLVSVFGCAYGSPSERGDAMFAVMVQRSCAAIRDLGTLDLV